MKIQINSVDDLKAIILKYDFTESQLSNLIFASLGVFFETYATKKEVVQKIDEVIKKYPTSRRPIFLENCFID